MAAKPEGVGHSSCYKVLLHNIWNGVPAIYFLDQIMLYTAVNTSYKSVALLGGMQELENATCLIEGWMNFASRNSFDGCDGLKPRSSSQTMANH